MGSAIGKTYQEFKKSLREVAESSTAEIATSAPPTSAPHAAAVGSPADDTMRP
jgi:Sec-independent protein translocase protein TatA